MDEHGIDSAALPSSPLLSPLPFAGVEELPFSAESYERDIPLEQSAAELLESYRGMDRCAPLYAGYLDLAGNVWSCEVSGDGWVDLCFVARAGDDGSHSRVQVVRLEEARWSEQVEESNGVG